MTVSCLLCPVLDVWPDIYQSEESIVCTGKLNCIVTQRMFQITLWSATVSCAGSATGWGTSRTRTTRWCRRSGRSARWCPSTRSTTCRTCRWRRWTASARASSLAARRQDGWYRPPRCWRSSALYTPGPKRLCGRGPNLVCERGCLFLSWVRAFRSLRGWVLTFLLVFELSKPPEQTSHIVKLTVANDGDLHFNIPRVFVSV